MTEQELEELVMRVSGNKAYFMPEDPNVEPDPKDDISREDLFKMARSLRKDLAG
jgi:hypothetical protein